MAYSALADIAAEFKSIIFSSASSVTDTEIDGFIKQADAEIDSAIAVRYALPVTDANALELLKAISVSIVADRVSGIIKVKTKNQKVEQESKTGVNSVWGRMMLKKLAKGEAFLVDANGQVLEPATSHGGISSFNVDCDVQNEMKKGTDQW